jgi:hypothetical protein
LLTRIVSICTIGLWLDGHFICTDLGLRGPWNLSSTSTSASQQTGQCGCHAGCPGVLSHAAHLDWLFSHLLVRSGRLGPWVLIATYHHSASGCPGNLPHAMHWQCTLLGAFWFRPFEWQGFWPVFGRAAGRAPTACILLNPDGHILPLVTSAAAG